MASRGATRGDDGGRDPASLQIKDKTQTKEPQLKWKRAERRLSDAASSRVQHVLQTLVPCEVEREDAGLVCSTNTKHSQEEKQAGLLHASSFPQL